MGIKLPQAVSCDDCGRTARVRACGRIEYEWPKTTTAAQTATMPTLSSARLTIDCPNCGVKTQDFFPSGTSSDDFRKAALQRQERYLQNRQISARSSRKPR